MERGGARSGRLCPDCISAVPAISPLLSHLERVGEGLGPHGTQHVGCSDGRPGRDQDGSHSVVAKQAHGVGGRVDRDMFASQDSACTGKFWQLQASGE